MTSRFRQLEAPAVMGDATEHYLAIEPLDKVAVSEVGWDTQIIGQLGRSRTVLVFFLVGLNRTEKKPTDQLQGPPFQPQTDLLDAREAADVP